MGYENDLVTQYKQKLKDYPLDEGLLKFDSVQIKYDGFWTLLEIVNGTMKVISSGGEVRQTLSTFVTGRHLIVAEWMFGTTWGNAYKEQTGIEFVMFDLLVWNGDDITDWSYDRRLPALRKLNLPGNFLPAGLYQKGETTKLLEEDIEGVVFRNRFASFGAEIGRYKKAFTMDYVYMGNNPGGGKYENSVGSIRGGLFVGGSLKAVCSVGGLTDELRERFNCGDIPVGTVFEARGKALFSSGALRHPAFMRLRSDKPMHECVI